MWLIMRGALDDKVAEIYRFYIVPASNIRRSGMSRADSTFGFILGLAHARLHAGYAARATSIGAPHSREDRVRNRFGAPR